ncbi:MAG: hypothetical protein ACREFO_02900 [Acetobacteraceae bacterium]
MQGKWNGSRSFRRDPDPWATAPRANTLVRDPFTLAKERATAYRAPERYEDIRVPRNNPMAVASGLVAAVLAGFGLAWHGWWLVILAVLIGTAATIWYGLTRTREKTIPARVVEQDTVHWLEAVNAATAITRADESSAANQGLAEHNA